MAKSEAVTSHTSSPEDLARRAERVFFLVEGHVARHAARSHHGLHFSISDHSAQRHRHAVLHAREHGERSSVRPGIQQMERFAAEWANLAPHDPVVRAAMAHALGREFVFTRERVPHIRGALGLDDEAVKSAYALLYHEPLDRIYAKRLAPIHHLHWFWSGLSHRLESMPPFWTAYALTLTETVGATILALPIAVASIGPLPGLLLLILLGIVNMLTIGFMSEAVARSGAIRYGTGFIGQVVADYLGGVGSILLTSALFSICILVLLAYYVGFSSALQAASGIPAPFWAAIMFLAALYFLRRDSLNATVASALVVGAVNIVIILAISALALTHLQPANLTRMDLPFVNGRPFDSSLLGLIFGVILTAYFGHLSVSNCGRVVLRRDPSGRSLILGNVAAQATAILLYSTFVIAVAGAVPAAQLATQTGTSLEPLAAQLGQGVHLLGSAFVILGIGMASIHFSLGLFNLVRERLPSVPGSHGTHLTSSQSRQTTLPGHPTPIRRLFDLMVLGRGRFLTEVSPVFAVFIIAEWSISTHSLGFTAILGFVGIITVTLLAGIFPILLIIASRRKGEYTPGTVYGFLGNPVLLACLYFVFLSGMVVHGLVIWHDPLERGVALFASLVVVGMTIQMIRLGLFRPRVVVELREEQNEQRPGVLSVTAAGRPTCTPVCLGYPSGDQQQETAAGWIVFPSTLRGLSLKVPPINRADLKVWLHRVTADGDSEPLSACIGIHGGESPHPPPPFMANGMALLPLPGLDCSLSIDLETEAS